MLNSATLNLISANDQQEYLLSHFMRFQAIAVLNRTELLYSEYLRSIRPKIIQSVVIAMSFLKFPEIRLDAVEAVLVDIDDTLYPYDPAHQLALAECHRLYCEETEDNIQTSDFDIWYRANRSAVTKSLSPQGACRSRLFAFQAMLEEKAHPNPFVLAGELENTYWQNFLAHMSVCLAAREFLAQCKALRIPVCAVSDMQAHIQIKKLDVLGVSKLIDFLVTSEEVGAEKPNRRMFETALRKLDCSADQAIMIGDSQSKDIVGAQSVGIKAYKVEVVSA